MIRTCPRYPSNRPGRIVAYGTQLQDIVRADEAVGIQVSQSTVLIYIVRDLGLRKVVFVEAFDRRVGLSLGGFSPTTQPLLPNAGTSAFLGLPRPPIKMCHLPFETVFP